MPAARQENMLQQKKFVLREQDFEVREWMHGSTCLPPAMFHYFWMAAFDRPGATEGGPTVVSYLKKEHACMHNHTHNYKRS